MRVALVVGPLAAYFAALGVLQGGRRPVIVPGPWDALLLACGLGGLLVFGPIGELLVRRLFPAPSLWAWLALASAYGLILLVWIPRTSRRLVIYRIRPEDLRRVVREALLALPGAYAPTVRGFEDREHGRGLTVEASHWLRSGTIDAYGRDPEALITAIGPILRDRTHKLADEPAAPTLAVVWFGLAMLTVLLPFATILMSRPQVLDALRALLDRLGGG